MSTAFTKFAARVASQDRDPEAVVALFVEALVALEGDEDTGREMIALLCSDLQRSPASGSPSGYRLGPSAKEAVRRVLRDRNIARSYAGASHGNGYTDFDASALDIKLDRNYAANRQGVDYPGPGQAKLFVVCGGADNPRPVTLTRTSDGHWRIHEWSSLTLGVRKPE